MTQLTGKWALESIENFDAYQKAIGVDDANRAKGNDLLCRTGADPTTEELTFTATTGKRILTAGGQSQGGKEFPLNVEFECPTLDGRKTKCKIVAESATKIVRYDTYENGVQGTQTSELVGDKMKTTMTAGGVTSTRVSKRV